MILNSAMCPCCGATIEVKKENVHETCPQCNAQFLTRAAIVFARAEQRREDSCKPENFFIEEGVLLEYLGGSQDVVVPDGVVAIGAGVFRDSNIISVEFPDSLTLVEEHAFRDCHFLKNVVLPPNVVRLEWGAFAGCSALEKVVLPKGLSAIGAQVFEYCVALQEIVLPDRLSIIGQAAFRGCASLREVILPADLIEVGQEAFAGCVSLEKANLPEGLQFIGKDVFVDCDKLKL